MAKNNTDNEQLKVQKKLLNVAEKHLSIGAEHKDISKKQLNESLSKNEQRFWWICSIVALFIVSGAVIHFLTINHNAIKNYEVSVTVSPNKVLLNEKNDINFKFAFTNNGLKNISDISVLGLYVYRIEDGKPVFKYELISPLNNHPIPSCNSNSWYGNDNTLPVGKSCTIDVKMTGLAYTTFFDDKDKQVQFYIYVKSTPPIENKIVNLTIY